MQQEQRFQLVRGLRAQSVGIRSGLLWSLALLALVSCSGPKSCASSSPTTPSSIRYASDDTPFLRLNTTSHNAAVTRAAITADGATFVTGSRDYTVKVWRSSDMRLVRTIRPPVSQDFMAAPGSGIRAVDISADGALIAAAGQVDNAGVRGTWRIFVFDAKTGEIVGSPLEAPAFIADLAFSRDGRFLAAGAYAEEGDPNNGLWVWDAKDWKKPIYRDADYGVGSPKGGRINGLAFNDRGVLITTSYDGRLRRYADVRKATPPLVVPAPKDLYPYDLQISPDGDRVLVGFLNNEFGSKPADGQPTVNSAAIIYATGDLRVERMLDVGGLDDGKGGAVTATAVRGVSWSRSGRYAYANLVQYAPGTSDERVRRWSVADGAVLANYAQCTDENVIQILPRGNDGALLFNVDPCTTLIDDKGEIEARYPGERYPIDLDPVPEVDTDPSLFLVSDNGGDVYLKGKSAGAGIYFSLDPARRGVRLNPVLTVDERKSLDGFVATRNGLSLTNWAYTKAPQLNGTDVSIRNKSNLTNNWSWAVDVAPKSAFAVLGANFTLDRYSRADKFDWRIFTSELAMRTNITPNENAIVVVYNDGVIRWHDPASGQVILSLFVDSNASNWVLWTPSGYYDASGGGEDLIGWHLNNGPDRAASFYGASRFREKFYKPAIIDEVIQAMLAGTAMSPSASDVVKSALSLNLARSVVRPSAPPVVHVDSQRLMTNAQGASMEIGFSVQSPSGKPVTGYQVLVDGATKVNQPGPVEPGRRMVLTVPIRRGDQFVSIVANTADGPGHAQSIAVAAAGDGAALAARPRPNMHALVIGVKTYLNGGNALPNLAYASDDARAFAAFLRTQENSPLFGNVDVRELIDGEATKANIESALLALRDAPGDDFIIVFLAGHGWRNDYGTYFFLSHDTVPVARQIELTSVKGDDIAQAIRQSPARAALFMDTCRAGNAVESKLQMQLNGLEKDVFIFSGASTGQDSYENAAWRHGAFTKAILEVTVDQQRGSLAGNLRGILAPFRSREDAVAGRDGALTSFALAHYLTRRVPELTRRETPVQTPQFFARGADGSTPDRDLFWVGGARP